MTDLPPHFSRNRNGVGKIVDFRHLSRRISETVQPCKIIKIGSKLLLTTNRNMCTRNALSIGTKIDDIGWPLSEIQGHWFRKCRQNGEIQLSNDSDAICRVVAYIEAYVFMRWCSYLLTYLLTQLARTYKTGNISEKVEDKVKVTNGLKSYTGVRLPPKCMTLNDLCAIFKVIDSLNTTKMAKYSLVMTPTPVQWVVGCIRPISVRRTCNTTDFYFSPDNLVNWWTGELVNCWIYESMNRWIDELLISLSTHVKDCESVMTMN